MSKSAAITIIACFAYAITRYVVAGDTPFRQIPAYVSNKALAMASVVLMLASAIAAFRSQPHRAKDFGRHAFYTGIAHGFITMALASPDYYGKFYADNKLTWTGECIILFGGVTASAFWLAHHRAANGSPGKPVLMSCSVLAMLHTVFMGIPFWATEPFFGKALPQISMVSFLLALATTAVYLLWRPKT